MILHRPSHSVCAASSTNSSQSIPKTSRRPRCFANLLAVRHLNIDFGARLSLSAIRRAHGAGLCADSAYGRALETVKKHNLRNVSETNLIVRFTFQSDSELNDELIQGILTFQAYSLRLVGRFSLLRWHWAIISCIRTVFQTVQDYMRSCIVPLLNGLSLLLLKEVDIYQPST